MSPRTLLQRLAGDKRFSMPAVLTLTVGIGATVAIFSLVYAVLLAPLPYPDPERLFDVSHRAPGLDLDDMDISVPLYVRYRERVRSFEEMALVRDERVSLTGLETPDRVRQGRVTASLFPLTGTAPRLGRTFTEEDSEPSCPGSFWASSGAFFMTRAMTSMLFAVSPLDPWSFVLAPSFCSE